MLRSASAAWSWSLLPLLLLSTTPSISAQRNTTFHSDISLLREQSLWLAEDRPPECPPCFNCLLPDFQCKQFAECSSRNGRCDCPAGWAGNDCLQPLCGSLAGGDHRPPKGDGPCECDEGWEGINCNVCKTDDVCNSLMPEGEELNAVCYKTGVAVKQNFQQCDVTNKKILEMLKRKPQVTFTCNKEDEACHFEFWVDQRESFYCALDDCKWELNSLEDRNVTDYTCNNVKCECIPGRTMCGENGTLDLTEFLDSEITGPAHFSCDSSKPQDQCLFSEPAMNGVITSIFGDETILLDCHSGECLHKSEVPGYTRPIKTINKPLIAGVIAGCALLVVAVVLGLWYVGRRASQRRNLGPIYLSDEDDEDGKLLMEHKPTALHFTDISYELNGKRILTGVQGGVQPGQVMAIMGASGAGKTTFLDLLARKNKRGNIGGEFYINGTKISDDNFKEIIGFVDQEDTMMATLTVYETILNSALLRLPRDMSFQNKNKRVLDVMSQLGITAIKDQVIGTSEDNGLRGISGGEKRRVSIACELVTSPSILFLDEPTSGLDSYNAYNVIECLVNLARNYKRTIIFTIHQPKSNIVALFDQLVLLAKGKCVYSGPFGKCQDYFGEQGYPCPPGYNIADYLVDLTVHAEQRQAFPQDDNIVPSDVATARSPPPAAENARQRPRPRKRASSIRESQVRQLFTRRSTNQNHDITLTDDLPRPSIESLARPSFDETDELLPPSARADETDLDTLVTAYKKSDIAKGIVAEITGLSAPELDENGNSSSNATSIHSEIRGFQRLGWWGQFTILSARTWKNLYRNPLLMLSHYAISIVLAVLCGYLFFGLTDSIAGFQNRMGLFFFVLALFGFSTLTSLNVFSHERTLFLRERANGYYSPIMYFTAKVLFDIVPLRIIPPIIMGTILYPMAGLVPEWPQFFKFLLVLVLFNLAAAAICLFIGIICKDTSVANLIGSLVMLFSLLLAGLLLNHDSIPKAAVWLQNVSIFHYGFEAMLVNEVRYLSLIEHKFGLDIEVPGATILSTFGFRALMYWWDVLGLGIFAATFLVAGYLAMHFLLVEKR